MSEEEAECSVNSAGNKSETLERCLEMSLKSAKSKTTTPA